MHSSKDASFGISRLNTDTVSYWQSVRFGGATVAHVMLSAGTDTENKGKDYLGSFTGLPKRQMPYIGVKMFEKS